MAEQDDDMFPEGWIGVGKAIQKYGLATVAAVVFGYVVIVDVRADQSEAKRLHETLAVEQQNLARGVLKLADRQGETQMLSEKILLVLREMCIQNAGTPAERRSCLKEK